MKRQWILIRHSLCLKRNLKTYNVLSIEEARIINKFARNTCTFLFEVFLILLGAACLLLPGSVLVTCWTVVKLIRNSFHTYRNIF